MNYKLENIGLNCLNVFPLAVSLYALTDIVYSNMILSFTFSVTYFLFTVFIMSQNDYLKKKMMDLNNNKMKIVILDYGTEEVLILPYNEEWDGATTLMNLHKEGRISNTCEYMIFNGKITIEE